MNWFKRFLLWLAGVKIETVLDPYQDLVGAIIYARQHRHLDPKIRLLCADTIYSIDRSRHCIPDINPPTTLKCAVCPPSEINPLIT